ncbi:hypothetical protein EON65_55225 [archaeon]|nr:MAG: hypothetical protein EON65_55225 [archaeon]
MGSEEHLDTATQPRRVICAVVILVLLPASDFFTDILYLVPSPFHNVEAMQWTIVFIFLPSGPFFYELFVMKDCRFKWHILQPDPALVDMQFELPNLEHVSSIEKLLFTILRRIRVLVAIVPYLAVNSIVLVPLLGLGYIGHSIKLFVLRGPRNIFFRLWTGHNRLDTKAQVDLISYTTRKR